jgi:hypothetical protein
MEQIAPPMWQILCPETGWRSAVYADREEAVRTARSIDIEIARVNGPRTHPHPVVEVHARLQELAAAG